MSEYRASVTPLFLIVVLLATGCASMQGGRSPVVLVESEPPGARILVGGKPVGVTPNFVKLERRDAAITLEKDGFLPEAVEVPRSMSGGVVLDVLLGGWLSTLAGPWVLVATLGFDLVTGAAGKLAGEVRATLEPEPEDVSPSPEGSRGPLRHLRTTEEGQ